ncbi:MAG: GTPase ObgE [SAR324 cluster bacterium]|nr:GTPase ObgE [SAR324 cluster bacterium]
MKFVDSVKIYVRSGRGGSGCTSFRREKYVPQGGPDGGDGGDGGSIVFVGDRSRSTLLDLSFQQHQHAEDGARGMGKNRHGSKGSDLKIPVPLGTVLRNAENGEVLLEVLEEREYLLLHGGRGGRGNARFKTSTNRAPEHHQPGESGKELWVQLELKLIADVGLLGFPNAGKSTLISSVSQARPKIADYPFTTLVPMLGVVRHGSHEPFVVADIPGIIEGAHQGRGLGDRFLRHVERTALLLVLLDVSGFSEHPPLEEYRMLLAELEQFSADLIRKPRLVALTKIDTLGSRDPLLPIREELTRCGEQVFSISAVTSEGLNELLNSLASWVLKIRSEESEASRSSEIQTL